MYGHMWEYIVLGKLLQGWLQVFPEGDELRPHVLFDALHAFWKRGDPKYLEVLTGETDVCHTHPLVDARCFPALHPTARRIRQDWPYGACTTCSDKITSRTLASPLSAKVTRRALGSTIPPTSQ